MACFFIYIWYNRNMSDTEGRLHRSAMAVQERQWRSKLAQLVSQHGFIRGTILERERVCGKPNCKCAKGQKHAAVYLVLSKEGRQEQLYVPKQWQAAVRQWVKNYHDLRDLMEKISETHWKKVQKRQG